MVIRCCKMVRHLHLGMCQFSFQYTVFYSCVVVILTEVYILHIVRTNTWVIYSLCVFILIYIAHLHELNLRAKLNTT